MKFTKRGGFVAVSLSPCEEFGGGVELTVQDSGIGIPQSAIASLFNRYTQVSRNTARKFGGTGLGLAITQQLVKLRPGDSDTAKCARACLMRMG